MSDSGGSLFEGFTEAEVRHIPPTQAVNSADVVVSTVRSLGLEPAIRTSSGFSAGSSSRQASVASTPAHSRHSRSRSRAPGLADQIRQILRAELWRGRDRLRGSSSYLRSSSSSRGSSDSQSSLQSDHSQSSGRHHRHLDASRSPRHSRHVRSSRSSSRSLCRHARRSYSYRKSDCSCSRLRSPRCRVRTHDRAEARVCTSVSATYVYRLGGPWDAPRGSPSYLVLRTRPPLPDFCVVVGSCRVSTENRPESAFNSGRPHQRGVVLPPGERQV